jgi:DNA-directed RNA polymerase subunit RPC12/RpoP
MVPKRSYRCGYCDRNWPLRPRYQRCPRCTTVLVANKIEPMSNRDAIKVLADIRRGSSFHMIIAEAGFTGEECQAIADLEILLA